MKNFKLRANLHGNAFLSYDCVVIADEEHRLLNISMLDGVNLLYSFQTGKIELSSGIWNIDILEIIRILNGELFRVNDRLIPEYTPIDKFVSELENRCWEIDFLQIVE